MTTCCRKIAHYALISPQTLCCAAVSRGGVSPWSSLTPHPSWVRRRRVLAKVATVIAAASACFPSPSAAPARLGGGQASSGAVDVLYAGSLLDLMENQIGPAFHAATGYNVVGVSAGSSALASEIQGGTEVGDVFISASPSARPVSEGDANGDWVSTYKEFATSPLVLGYNPSSPFASALRTRPWYEVVTRTASSSGAPIPRPTRRACSRSTR